MGNSMFSPARLAELGWLTKPVDIFNEHHNRHYQIYARGPKVYQSEYELDHEGKEIFRHTEELQYVIGTGSNGATPIVRRGNFLFEAPLSYYSATRSWNLSPNFDVSDIGFSLPMTSDCINCHSGQSQPVRGREALYYDPAVVEPAIGCEKCHGPGELHVKERQTDAPIPSGVDTSIVNPAKLSPWLADNICMNCHEGDIRTLQAGKTWEDFRPGTPLNDTVVILKAPINPQAEQSPLLEHYYSMTLSKCYRESRGKLGCQSCHDPHIEPSREDAPHYFREKCLHCHTEKSCTMDLNARMARQPDDACPTCHLPKRAALTVSHSSLTDHRIIRTSDEPYPKMATQPSLTSTGFIHVDAVPGKPDNVAPIALLKAYRQELIRSHLEYKDYYRTLVDRLAKSASNDSFALSAIAQKLANQNDVPKAVSYARQVVDRGSTSESDYLLLDGLLARSGNLDASIGVLKKGLAIAPYSNSIYESLAARQLSAGHTSDGLATLRQGLELFPEDSVLRDMQQQTLSNGHLQQGIAQFQQGNFQGAMGEFRAAVAANPEDAVAHDYIGMILGESGEITAAITEFQQAARLDNSLAGPHAHLGLAYAKTGRTQTAILEYQEALRLDPKMLEAQYGLSEICTKLGDLDGAIMLLRSVTQAEPDFAEAHSNLGLNLRNRYNRSEGLRQKSDLEEAAQQLKQAADLDPKRPTTFLALGQIFSDQGDFPQAVDSLKKAVDLDPSNADCHYNLGLALRLKGELEAAGAEFRTALKFAPQHGLARRSLGLVLRETGDLESAASELRQSVSELPDDAQGHHLLGTVLLKQNDLNGASQEFGKAITLDPNLTEARASLSQALQKAGRKDEAQQASADLRKMKEEGANLGQAMILVQTAAGYSEKQDFTSAVRTLQEAVSLSPNLGEARYQLGLALRREGDKKKSEEVFREVLRLDPDHAGGHLNLGLLLADRGDVAQAHTELETALQRAPSLVEAHAVLARLAANSKDWPAAVREYQAVVAWSPQNQKAHYDLANSLKANGQTEAAAHEFQVAQDLASKPQSAR
jgi:tetratricopeptide (TPR) repeat protein